MSYHTSGSMRSYGGGYGTISIGLANSSKLERGVTYSYTVNGTRYTAVADTIPGTNAVGLIDSNYTLPNSPPPFQENSSIVILDDTGLSIATTKITSITNYDSNGNGGKGNGQESMTDTFGQQTTTTSYQGEQQEQEEMETQSSSSPVNPIVEVGLESPITNPALFIYQETGEPYFGLYHEHQDGTLMVGEGVLGIDHDMNPSEIIIPNNVTLNGDDVTTPTLQPQMSISQIREMFADTVYSKWFGDEFNDEAGNYTFKDMRLPVGQRESTTQIDVKSIQSTIRNGKVVTGRQDGEQLVFYKNDSNTPESKKDYEDSKINEILTDISASVASSPNDEFDLQSRLSFVSAIDRGNDGNGSPVGVELTNQYGLDFLFDGEPTEVGTAEGENPYRIKSFKYELIYNLSNNETKKINIGELAFINKVQEEEINWYWYGWVNVLNLSQITTPISSTKINSEKAREVLDTNIFELLPSQTTRQDEINNFFQDFNNLIGDPPEFQDVDGDGLGESAVNQQEDEQNRISFENKPTANITRLESQTLETMRNTLNQYLGDVDNVVESIEDERPEYENKSRGFLKIRKPNQAIILRAPLEDELEFQKNDSFLTEGFTITMWVRFVGKTGRGTLFNFGNPISTESPYGFTLETVCNIHEGVDDYTRAIRLGVYDHNNGEFYDSAFGNMIETRQDTRVTKTWSHDGLFTGRTYTSVPTNDLNEWFFICASYNPTINEGDFQNDFRNGLNGAFTSKLYWENHYDSNSQEVVAFSGEGARCKVEVISRSDLLRARGFKVGDISFNPNVTPPPPPPPPPPDELDDESGEAPPPPPPPM
mgnify:CR=1 FL=1